MSRTSMDDSATATRSMLYLYAVIDEPRVGTNGLIGIDSANVRLVATGSIAAVVSPLEARKVRPERRRLAAHNDILKHLMADHAVLPMAFGLVAESEDDVIKMLRLNRHEFCRHLDRVRGRVEMGVRVKWDVPNVFAMMTEQHQDLKELRDRSFRGGREPSHEEKIEIGRLFNSHLSADREEYTGTIVDALSPVCREISTNPPRNEHEVSNIACLVDLDRLEEFEQGVRNAADRFDNRFAFDYSGPWPPHNFSSVELKLS